MGKLLFGTAGVPISAASLGIVEGLRQIKALGLDGMELEFVRGIYPDENGCREVAKAAGELGLRLSAHAPYYLNFNAHEPSKRRASQGILHKAARIASLCGASDLVFHVGFYLGDDAEEAYRVVRSYLAEVLERLRSDGVGVVLRPEIMGKRSQFGSLEETLRLCQDIGGLAPCIDFAHWHARTGVVNTYFEFSAVLGEVASRLGDHALSDLHLHISGIAYNQTGEVRHLPLRESDLNYIDLIHCLKDHDATGIVISESPVSEQDALLLKSLYESLS